jgi:hypothetical protein
VETATASFLESVHCGGELDCPFEVGKGVYQSRALPRIVGGCGSIYLFWGTRVFVNIKDYKKGY